MAPLEQQLVVHRDLAHLGAQALDLVVALVRGPALQRRLAAGEELLAPVGQRRRGHSELTRQAIERLPAQQAQERVRLAARREPSRLTPAVGVGWCRRARE